MSSDRSHCDYDYLIYDSQGVRKVMDGVEYHATQDDLPQEHKNSGCSQCNFVSDAQTLFVFLISREVKTGATENPQLVGKFTMPGWVGHSDFYVFRCRFCREVSVDYPHGYCGVGCLYLSCRSCQKTLILDPGLRKDIYESQGVPLPKLTLEEREADFMEMVRQVQQERGVKVIVSQGSGSSVIQRLRKHLGV